MPKDCGTIAIFWDITFNQSMTFWKLMGLKCLESPLDLHLFEGDRRIININLQFRLLDV